MDSFINLGTPCPSSDPSRKRGEWVKRRKSGRSGKGRGSEQSKVGSTRNEQDGEKIETTSRQERTPRLQSLAPSTVIEPPLLGKSLEAPRQAPSRSPSSCGSRSAPSPNGSIRSKPLTVVTDGGDARMSSVHHHSRSEGIPNVAQPSSQASTAAGPERLLRVPAARRASSSSAASAVSSRRSSLSASSFAGSRPSSPAASVKSLTTPFATPTTDRAPSPAAEQWPDRSPSRASSNTRRPSPSSPATVQDPNTGRAVLPVGNHESEKKAKSQPGRHVHFSESSPPPNLGIRVPQQPESSGSTPRLSSMKQGTGSVTGTERRRASSSVASVRPNSNAGFAAPAVAPRSKSSGHPQRSSAPITLPSGKTPGPQVDPVDDDPGTPYFSVRTAWRKAGEMSDDRWNAKQYSTSLATDQTQPRLPSSQRWDGTKSAITRFYENPSSCLTRSAKIFRDDMSDTQRAEISAVYQKGRTRPAEYDPSQPGHVKQALEEWDSYIMREPGSCQDAVSFARRRDLLDPSFVSEWDEGGGKIHAESTGRFRGEFKRAISWMAPQEPGSGMSQSERSVQRSRHFASLKARFFIPDP